MKDYFEFLNNLRESGEINMFGSVEVLQEVFGMSPSQARDVFLAWTKTFKE